MEAQERIDLSTHVVDKTHEDKAYSTKWRFFEFEKEKKEVEGVHER